MSTVDFWFDYSCPYAYLGSTQVEGLAARTGARLVWKPMLLGGVFAASGTPQKLFATLSAAKAQHNARDLDRWAELFGVRLVMPAAHPMRTVEALRATIACAVDPRVVHGFFRAYWIDGRPPSDEATIRDVLGAAGHDAGAILAAIARPEAKDDLRRRTDQAVARGIFGAPAFVLDDGVMFWGQDRMHMVERALGGSAPEPVPAAGGTMAHTLEVYWDFSSPFAYLGSTQAEKLAARTGAKLVWRPMLLGGVFKSIGQAEVPLFTWSDAKKKYYYEDMHRWAEYWGVPFRFPTRFPMLTLKALRAYLALPESRRDAFREKTFRAYWAEDRDIADEAVLRECVGEGADEVLARTQSPEVKKALIDATQHAVEAGVFGAPTWVVDGKELFWGQDRIPLVERALAR
ncbi:MAG TPA: 2-hydroxychromene-2-carboxylate isomerase [Polyangiaceae bacterium]